MGSLIARKKVIMMMQKSVIDTSPVILEYDKRYNNNGSTSASDGMCITKVYEIPEVLQRRLRITAYGTSPSMINYFNGTYKDYWNRDTTSSESTVIMMSVGCNQITFTLKTSMLDDCYTYIEKYDNSDTPTYSGMILFAGRNTPYYGHLNINELS